MNRNAAYHIAYGRHSLIPECCIRFYVDEWDVGFESKWRGTTYDKLVNEANYGYVPCPSCLFTKQQVRIRDCASECGRECWKDY